MADNIDILGDISAEQFLAEYWQKKPLLVRQALPEMIDILEPKDVMELALEDTVTARLIKQKDKDPKQWSVKSSPLIKGDFQKMPKLWTLLVQAVDHYSFDVAEMWKKFSFIPQWRRDDIMVSYAQKGGSVGQHFDFYDVFLVQGYGHRRWQLGQMCDANTPLQVGQPLKLLTEMDVVFDEVLAPGDLLYVPPGLSHYGVAEDECLTFSFGFRMPNTTEMLDHIGDQFAQQEQLKQPLQDLAREQVTAVGEVHSHELTAMKQALLAQLTQSDDVESALMCLLSEPKYLDSVPEPEEIGTADLQEALGLGYQLALEPASRLLYRSDAKALQFWGNGEALCISDAFSQSLKQLADGQSLLLDEQLAQDEILEDIAELMNQAILTLLPPAEDA